jgi:tRNA pseudouridine55 synthase
MKNPGKPPTDLFGLFVVDKPIGWSSMDVVRRVRRAAGGAKCGHAGTLDPLATGVVICCLGKATQWVSSLMDQTKVYETEIDLSAFTTTDDLEGERREANVTTPPHRSAVESALTQFVGAIAQAPPAFSAVHLKGVRAYKLARKGVEVTIAPRQVRIDRIDLLSYQWPLLCIRVTCGKGTYIRSLGRDIGHALGAGGHLTSLRRLAVGPYTVQTAANSTRLQQPIEQQHLIIPTPPRTARAIDTLAASQTTPIQTTPTTEN